jgi:hypothetical protein
MLVLSREAGSDLNLVKSDHIWVAIDTMYFLPFFHRILHHQRQHQYQHLLLEVFYHR